MIKNLLPIVLKMVTYFVETFIEDKNEKNRALESFNAFLRTLEDAGLNSVRVRKSVKGQRERLKKRLKEL